jgi:hypothetical protein
LTCAKCRYSLAGLTVSGVCPECAYPIERSLPGGLLKFLGRAELEGVRVNLGRMAAALVVLALFTVATDVTCPQLRSAPAFSYLWGAGAAAVLPLVLLCWWPLLSLRRQTVNARVRRAAVISAAGLALAGAMAVFTLLVLVLLAKRQLIIDVALGAHLLGRFGLAAFFVWGTRYSRAVAHDADADAARHRLVAWLGVVGSLVPATLSLTRVPGAVPFVLRMGLTLEGVSAALYWLVALGGVTVGLACLLWVGILGRAERRTAQYIAVLEAATLRKQLEGVE